MNQSQALAGFAALSQETRLKIVRRLVRAGPDGVAAGDLADAVGVSPSNISFHLKELERAGLIEARREARSIIYSADYESLRELIGFLMKDCCNGRPEIARRCSPIRAAHRPKQKQGGDNMPEQRPLHVLFLCTGNSARSVMAEAILNREGRGKFKAFSAGSQPKGAVHPYALDLLRKLNFDVSGFRSKSWNEFSRPDAPRLDFVFTVCDNAAAETCPFWPGQPMTAHWGIPDPAAATGTEAEIRLAFADAFRMLSNRISIFVNLPISSLDRMALQRQLDAIGKAKDSAA